MKLQLYIFVVVHCSLHVLIDAQNISDYEWLGTIHTHEGVQACRLRTQNLSTTFTIYQHIAWHWQVHDLYESGQEFSFIARNGANEMKFNGNKISAENKIVSTMIHQSVTYAFELNQRVPLTADQYRPFIGTYRTNTGLVFLVTENQQTLHLHSPVSGEYVVLKLIGHNKFHTRTGEKYHFTRDESGTINKLIWTDKHQNRLEAVRFDPYAIEEMVFYTRQDTIYGSLYLPKNKSSNPAMMLALGAGRFDRQAYTLEAEILASEGIASLIIDFPGTGKSSGNLHDNTFDQKRDMTIDIFRDLQKHPRIDDKRCGIRGGSQSGRIALMAAAEIPDIAAVISVNVPLKSQLETQLFAINQFLRSRGVDEATNTEACHLWKQYFDQIQLNKIDTSFVLAIEEFNQQHEGIYLPSVPNTHLPRSPHPSDLASNTTDILANITCPVLFQLSVLDERVPFASTRSAISAAVANHENLDFSVIEYPFANHSLMLPGYQITQGLFNDKLNWLKKQLFINRN